MISVFPEWISGLRMQQQSVLLLASRGPDGVGKNHPCKSVVRAYRGTVLKAALYGRELKFGEAGDTFMSLQRFADEVLWKSDIRAFYDYVDELPHHYTMHLLHGAEIIAYKHPNSVYRSRWMMFYERGCTDMHLPIETEAAMDDRLSDWQRELWDSVYSRPECLFKFCPSVGVCQDDNRCRHRNPHRPEGVNEERGEMRKNGIYE